MKKVYEAARSNKDGTLTSREMDKKKQYDGLGLKSHFEEVSPDLPDDLSDSPASDVDPEDGD